MGRFESCLRDLGHSGRGENRSSPPPPSDKMSKKKYPSNIHILLKMLFHFLVLITFIARILPVITVYENSSAIA